MEFLLKKRFQNPHLIQTYVSRLFKNRFIQNHFHLTQLHSRFAPISACIVVGKILLVADKLGFVVALSEKCDPLEISIAFVGVELLFAVDDHSAIVVAANHTVNLLSFFIRNSKLDVSTKLLTALDHVTDCLSLHGKYCWNISERCLYYINNKNTVSCAANQTEAEASFLCYSSSLGVVRVSLDNQSLYSESTKLFSVPFQITWTSFLDDRYMLLASIQDQLCWVIDLATSTKYVLSMLRINLSLEPCYWKEADCLLFVGEGPGEVFMFEFQSLFPADQLNSAHHRIRLNCACITALLLVENYHFYVCDELGGVYSLSLFL